ncbi:MAG: alpha-N-arabinofuranosidase [Clostridia bacterium]|nr:alpha-N-arabinofuranosidase [Clostridia bacterium]
MSIELNINPERIIGVRSPMLYGHFIEHFHRQIYDGIFDPQHPLSDEDGFRTDIVKAMQKIKVPILRWPGGCFVSAYHWKEAVGPDRLPSFDKAWRVEDPNTFGTDEYVKLCRKIGCEPYICTNAGSGTAEEMSDWVEYCNLETEGRYAKWRIANGYEAPHKVKYWSIGNENWGAHEIGAKDAVEWGKLVREAAKMIRRVDPAAELSAAALPDINWNINLLQTAGQFLDWISIHQYWDFLADVNNPANYEAAMAMTDQIDRSVRDVRGILTALHLEKKIKIAFDEWNLRGWHHPHIVPAPVAASKDQYLPQRDKNDDNSTYTMADAVFSACFLNAMNRNCDIVGMANFAPILNTRGCIYSHRGGIVLRSTYHVFDLYVNYLGDTVIDLWVEDTPRMTVCNKRGRPAEVECVDLLATKWSDREGIAIAAVNKHPTGAQMIRIPVEKESTVTQFRCCGSSPDSYNDIDRTEVFIETVEHGKAEAFVEIEISPHSVNIIHIL